MFLHRAMLPDPAAELPKNSITPQKFNAATQFQALSTRQHRFIVNIFLNIQRAES